MRVRQLLSREGGETETRVYLGLGGRCSRAISSGM